MKDEQYFLNQTPIDLCLDLVEHIPIEFGDTVWEPFAGEKSFYNAIRKKTQQTEWTEIEDGKDYKDIEGKFDWIITNPPFNGTGSFAKLLMELSDNVNKGIAFLGNQYCFTSLTPKRLKILEDKGLCLSKVVVCNVKKWFGKYYLMVFTRTQPRVMDYLLGSY